MNSTPMMLAFRASDSNRARLGELLKEPVLVAALMAIREAGIPRSIPNLDSRNHPDTIVAHDYYEKVGINGTLDMLTRLTYPPNKAPDESAFQEVPFEHTLPEHLRTPPKPFIPKR